MAFKCPVRKDVLKQKITNKKKKKDIVPESDIRSAVAHQIREELPDNYLAVIASAITLADVREKECPGTFQYIIDEMYMTNNMHRVSFPATVITGYQHHRIKKRAREGSEEVEEGAVGGSIFTGEYIITPLEPSVASSPMTMPSPLAVPSTPTPANTPASTPASTPAHSPLRMDQSSVRQKPPPIPAKKKEKRDQDAGVVLMTHTASKLPKGRMSHDTKVKYLQSAKMLKYIYQNNKYDREVVKDQIKQKKIDLTNKQIHIVEESQFHRVQNGQYLRLQTELFTVDPR